MLPELGTSSMLSKAGSGEEKPGTQVPSGADASIAHAQKWLDHKARHALQNRKWRERTKKWREENKDRVREFRRAWKDGAAPERLAGLLAAQGGKCKMCGISLEHGRHLDHVLPRSRGGKSNITNYQFLCPPCNTAKGTFTNEEFLEHIRLILLYNGKWWE